MILFLVSCDINSLLDDLPTVIPPINNLSLDEVSANSVKVSWDGLEYEGSQVSGITYQITVSNELELINNKVPATSVNSSYTNVIPGLSSGKVYQITVKAVDSQEFTQAESFGWVVPDSLSFNQGTIDQMLMKVLSINNTSDTKREVTWEATNASVYAIVSLQYENNSLADNLSDENNPPDINITVVCGANLANLGCPEYGKADNGLKTTVTDIVPYNQYTAIVLPITFQDLIGLRITDETGNKINFIDAVQELLTNESSLLGQQAKKVKRAIIDGVQGVTNKLKINQGTSLAPLTGLTITDKSPGGMLVTWNPVGRATSYEIYLGRNGATNRMTNTTASNYTVFGLAANTEYTFLVKACAGSLCSPFSSLGTNIAGSGKNDFAAILALERIPSVLADYDESAQAIFSGYTPGAAINPRYILPNGTGDGSSWSNAAGSLKDVLENKTPNASTDKVYAVLLGPGIYQSFRSTGNEISMANYVTIIGGVSQSNTISDDIGGKTILDGRSIHQIFNNDYANKNPLTSTARLYGVTIADGKTTGNGGGMHNVNSSPALTKVIFSGNSSGIGGGMYNKNSSPTLTKVIFSNNTAGQGGGMYNDGSSPVLTQVVFLSNTARDSGGGLYNFNSSPILTRVVFLGNSSRRTGGGMTVHNNTTSSSSLKIMSSIFWENRVGNTTNQIYFRNSSQITLSLYNSTVDGGMPDGYISGTTTNSFSGGGFSSSGSANIVVNFSDITSTNPGIGPVTDNGWGDWLDGDPAY